MEPEGKFIKMCLLRSISYCFSTGSSSSSCSSAQDSKHIKKKKKQNNMFKEEIHFEDIDGEELGTWEMPRIP